MFRKRIIKQLPNGNRIYELHPLQLQFLNSILPSEISSLINKNLLLNLHMDYIELIMKVTTENRYTSTGIETRMLRELRHLIPIERKLKHQKKK